MKLSIPTPCNESFDQFEVTKAGGFCQNCQKEVIDFTSMTDAEVLWYFKEKQGKTCGYFHASQLKSYPAIAESPGRWSPKWIGASLLGIYLFTFFPITNTYAQTNNVPQAIDMGYSELAKISTSEPKPDSSIISGIVVGKEGYPMEGVSVWVEGTSKGMFTDAEGKFSVKGVGLNDVLKFSYVGYRSKTYVIKEHINHRDEFILDIKMDMDQLSFLGEVAVAQSYSSKKTIWQKLSRLFK